ncbi:MAG: DUF3068 domain-containing protein [Actinobacteria bacterium]|nr:MAG: DUF3068 domain-containing protein [Actinomycetota bacterium]
MRRTLGYIAFTLGCLLIFTAPLMRWYALPRVEKAPYDVDEKTVSLGSGQYFSPATFSLVGPVPVQNTQTAKGIPAKSNHRVAVINLFSRTVDLVNDVGMDYTNDVFAFDRNTGFAVHCCDEQPRHAGYTLKLPFNIDKSRAYPFWDTTAKAAIPVRYVRTEEVAGLQAYVFQSYVDDMAIGTLEIPASFDNGPDDENITATRHYRATTTLWVEPFTGAILKGGQVAAQWVTNPQGKFIMPLAFTDLLNDRASVERTAKKIRDKLFQLRFVDFWFPVIGPLVGLVLLALSAVLLRRPRARRAGA